MDNTLGNNLRKLRAERGLSLDETAKITGVSKAMLGQVERGESSPTVSSLWKIAAGLRVTFSSLMATTPTVYASHSLNEFQPIYEAEKKLVLYNIFPFDPVTGFDYFHILIKAGCHYESPTHSNVQEEFIIVTKGKIKVSVGEQVFLLCEGDSIRFRGNESHSYANPFEEDAIYQNIMKY